MKNRVPPQTAAGKLTAHRSSHALLRSLTLTPLLILVVVALSATSASAAPACEGCTPWWHLTSGSRPSVIQPGSAKDEVQELKVNATAKASPSERNEVVIKAKGISKPVFFAYNAEAPEVQSELEKLYGEHNVAVTGGPTGKTPGQIVTELEPYVVTFKGELAYTPVPLMETEYEPLLEGNVKAVQVAAGRPDGEIVVKAENVGDSAALGGASTIKVGDVLPASVEAIGISGEKLYTNEATAMSCKLATLTCEWSNEVAPYAELEVRIAVLVKGAGSGAVNHAVVSGGRAAEASLARGLRLSDTPAAFGIEDYELLNEEAGGAIVTQAGQHPFQQTTIVELNQGADTKPLSERGESLPVGLAKDTSVKWPAGLIGNAAALPRCITGQFLAEPGEHPINECPPDTAVGVATVDVYEPISLGVIVHTVPVFNLEPRRGEPARFGFYEPGAQIGVYFDTAVRSGGDYGVTVSSSNITQTAAFLALHITVWGTPGDPRHNASRGWACLVGERESGAPCEPGEEVHPPPFLSMPTSCTGPLQSTVEGDSWEHPGKLEPLAEYQLPALDGCNQLGFAPQIEATPDDQQASTPTGLNVDVHVPQEINSNAAGLASSNVKSITVTFPAGVALNPSSAGGLQACAEGQVGFEAARGADGFEEFTAGVKTPIFSPYLPGGTDTVDAVSEGLLPESDSVLQPGVNFCPDASKIATVTIKSPLLPSNQPVVGALYLASPQRFDVFPAENPFESVLAAYIVAEDPESGFLVKLPGKIELGGQLGVEGLAPGQIRSTFAYNPELAFEDAEIHLLGGERAPLATPSRCGAYTTTASFTPWSGTPPVTATSTFDITSGPNGGPCPGASLPFKPTLTGGAENVNAGAFSPFTATFSRLSGEQNMQSIEAKLPPGLSGILSGVELCPEPQANLGECGPNSLIGETTVSVGVGGEPYTVSGGKFYLTGPYNGTGSCTTGTPGCAPFGVTFTVPAKAGPFDFADTPNNHPPCDCVLVRGKIEINPVTAAITITSNPPGTSDAIPTSIEGIPLEIQHINAITTRANFQFNPTNCSKMEVTGTAHSSEGATDTIGVPFQVTNCAALKFEPKVSISTSGKASKANGSSLSFKIAYPKGAMGSQSWMKEMKFDIPKQLPARLTTIQKACLAATFETNRGACPPASIIGHVLVHTPVLPVPLEGPLYFVSYGGAAFPDAVAVLHGYGLTIESHGHTFIGGGVTSATFEAVPDVPFESIEVTVPQGPFSEFGVNLPHGSYDFCGQKLAMPTFFKAQNGMEIHQNTPINVTGCPKPLTNKQKLAAALKACHKKKNKAKRQACERAARKKFGAKKANAKKSHR